MRRQSISSPGAVSIGLYSHAVVSGEFLFFSGQTPVNPDTGKLVSADIAVQAQQCFANLFAVLSAAGLTQDDVVKVNVYLTSMDDFPAMNAVYAHQFQPPYPARTTVGVAALPLGAKIEIEMIARKPPATSLEA
jgi:2-iminobutanoate/2-iminopropanoate deaminase